MNGYLIPANSKKSMLILGLFEPLDLIIFLSGTGVSLILFLIFSATSLTSVIIVLAPALVCSFLVMPVPNYHNIRVVIMELWRFYTTRQQFVWKGWCVTDGEESKK